MKKTLFGQRWTCTVLAAGAFLAPRAWGAGPPHRSGRQATGSAQTQSTASALERMPDFRLKDTTGRELSLSRFHGKVLIVDFWATWCAPCKQEMPGYQALYRRYKDRGVAVVGIAADSDAGLVARFGGKLGIAYPLLINGMDVQRYGVEGLPTTILVDRDGFIRKKVVGFEYTRVIERALDEILRARRAKSEM